MDFHLKEVLGDTISITRAAAGSFDSHRTGVEPNGTYWGASFASGFSGQGGDNIDVQSGILNQTLPLLKVVGRGQTSVQLALLRILPKPIILSELQFRSSSTGGNIFDAVLSITWLVFKPHQGRILKSMVYKSTVRGPARCAYPLFGN
ncbi:MAG TPA: hypothetical protein VGK29_23920 [Paludibaculum sp.]|jgi:hypothetical protein